VQAANPLRYVTASDPPLMILHGGSDPVDSSRRAAGA